MRLEKTKKLLLIDTFGLMYRFFYTLPRMNAPDGTPTNAVYGLARVLMKLMRESGADYIVPAMESKIPTFRHEMYAEYKAHRDKMPDSLREQIPIINEVFAALNLIPAQADGFEADDLIGSVARLASERGIDVEIITGDKDILQLVDGRVRVLMSRRGVTDLESFDPEKVAETMGVPPERIIDRKALEGDKSDNIPGVAGIGEKTALELLTRFGSLEGIYENLDSIDKVKLREKLEAGRGMAELSRTLATIKRDVPFETPFEEFALKGFDHAALLAFVTKYGFRTLAKEIGPDPNAAAAGAGQGALELEEQQCDFRCIFAECLGDLTALLDKAREKKLLCIDLETTGLDTLQDEIVGISIATEPGDACYIPIRHEAPTAEEAYTGDMFAEAPAVCDPAEGGLTGTQLSPEKALELLRPVLEDASIGKMGHNLKFDYVMLRSAGIRMAGIAFDSMIASYLLSPDTRGHALKTLAGRMLNAQFKTYKDIVGAGKKEISFKIVPLDVAAQYACNDVDVVLRIKDALLEKLRENELMDVFEKIEMPLVETLSEIEFNGVAIDSGLLGELSARMTKTEAELVRKAHELTDIDTNFNSPKQVADLLFNRLGLPVVKKQSTDISVLEELKDAHEVVPVIIEYRQISKLRGTYVDALPALVKKNTGRIHTSFNQTIAGTGRLSSSDPNLQNIPIRTQEGREIRRAFIAPGEGRVLLSADYSQVEIRLLAHLCGDENLINAFREGQDIHARTASDVFGVPLDEVSSDQRRYAKTINFGIIYGMREFNLSKQLGISRREAAGFIENYFSRYPAVREFVDETIRRVQLDGYVTTLFGRRRLFPEAGSQNRNEREGAFRAAVNTRIQGTAADVMKLAMVKIQHAIDDGEIPAKMILQVHDELVFEVGADDVSAVARDVRHLMETCMAPDVELSVPLTVDVSAGPNWLDTKEVEE